MSELEFTIRECVKKQPELRVIFVEGCILVKRKAMTTGRRVDP